VGVVVEEVVVEEVGEVVGEVVGKVVGGVFTGVVVVVVVVAAAAAAGREEDVVVGAAVDAGSIEPLLLLLPLLLQFGFVLLLEEGEDTMWLGFVGDITGDPEEGEDTVWLGFARDITGDPTAGKDEVWLLCVTGLGESAIKLSPRGKKSSSSNSSDLDLEVEETPVEVGVGVRMGVEVNGAVEVDGTKHELVMLAVEEVTGRRTSREAVSTSGRGRSSKEISGSGVTWDVGWVGDTDNGVNGIAEVDDEVVEGGDLTVVAEVEDVVEIDWFSFGGSNRNWIALSRSPFACLAALFTSSILCVGNISISIAITGCSFCNNAASSSNTFADLWQGGGVDDPPFFLCSANFLKWANSSSSACRRFLSASLSIAQKCIYTTVLVLLHRQ
jgi:hypothetical protein